MMQRTGLALLAALACLPGAANSQEALASEYGYKLAGKTEGATYFLSGIRRGAEPDSVEAWIWTMLPEPTGAGSEVHDAVAQRSVLRCEGRSIEALKSRRKLLSMYAIRPWKRRGRSRAIRAFATASRPSRTSRLPMPSRENPGEAAQNSGDSGCTTRLNVMRPTSLSMVFLSTKERTVVDSGCPFSSIVNSLKRCLSTVSPR